MKYINSAMLFLALFFAGPVFSQSPAFDSSYVILSSEEYDFRNPSFYKCGSVINYFIADALFAYEKWSSGTVSNIGCRLITYNAMSPEVMLTNDQDINSKPAVAYFSDLQPQNNKGAVVFESNRNGNKDVYFASFNGSVWSSAVNLTLSMEDEKDPAIMPYGSSGVYNYLIAYEKTERSILKISSAEAGLMTSALHLQNHSTALRRKSLRFIIRNKADFMLLI